MNITNILHGLLAVVVQCFVAGLLWAFRIDPSIGFAVGGALGVGFYWGREVEQVECKNGRDPWWVGFNLEKWSLDNALDLLFPVVFCMLVGVIVGLVF